jgi:hypothetical protein
VSQRLWYRVKILLFLPEDFSTVALSNDVVKLAKLWNKNEVKREKLSGYTQWSVLTLPQNAMGY